MPKVKTHSGAKKRLRIGQGSKIKRWSAFKRHCLSKRIKSTKQKRKLTHSTWVHPSNFNTMRHLLVI